ncbi:hypothetical protein CFC21_054460 [Triticum aestivum]|uniref:SIAH-type domain-containing protein n=2 Tax=Triticum aestivum TaxID=4565 RepID=A0A3B6HZL2_WHEAT|nr:uncharacterized protein LOC123082837 [Triticum aestivum]KAF7045348.1 hypothetical protein CFC21_054460 [Triticum aestivum]
MNHKFRKLGCGETVKFTELRSHEEEACPYATYSCPFDGCAYRGALLYDHVHDEHAQAPAPVPNCDMVGGLLRGATVTLRRDEPVHTLLHRDRVSVILLLNGGDVLTGRSLSLVRICPHPKPDQEDEEVEYRMVVMRGEPGPGSPSLTASGRVQYVRRLEGCQPQHFLFVPDAFWGSSGSVVVTVHL